jgi:hypothetical protein
VAQSNRALGCHNIKSILVSTTLVIELSQIIPYWTVGKNGIHQECYVRKDTNPK